MLRLSLRLGLLRLFKSRLPLGFCGSRLLLGLLSWSEDRCWLRLLHLTHSGLLLHRKSVGLRGGGVCDTLVRRLLLLLLLRCGLCLISVGLFLILVCWRNRRCPRVL